MSGSVPMAMSPAMTRLLETASAKALARIRVLNTSVVPTPASASVCVMEGDAGLRHEPAKAPHTVILVRNTYM